MKNLSLDEFNAFRKKLKVRIKGDCKKKRRDI